MKETVNNNLTIIMNNMIVVIKEKMKKVDVCQFEYRSIPTSLDDEDMKMTNQSNLTRVTSNCVNIHFY